MIKLKHVMAFVACACMTAQATEAPAQDAWKKAHIRSVEVENGKLVVRGSNLIRVKLFVTPAGTGIKPRAVEDAVRITARGSSEVWFVSIPATAEDSYLSLVVDLYFVATDRSGHKVRDRAYLLCGARPCVGVGELSTRIYGNEGISEPK